MLTTRPRHPALRLVRLLLVLAAVFAVVGLLVGYARGAEPDSNAARDLGAVQRGDISCRQLSVGRAEGIGELVMGRMLGSPQAHQAMDNLMTRMMGERGEQQMHGQWAGGSLAAAAACRPPSAR